MITRHWRQGTPIGEIGVVVADGVVVGIALPGSRLAVPHDAEAGVDLPVAEQLDAYFTGARRRFDVPFDLSRVRAGFHRTVLETLAKSVPYGETVTYGELAALAGRPRAARAVGAAMHANPVPIIVPCHRVVASNGIGGFGGGVEMKQHLLTIEGRSLSA